MTVPPENTHFRCLCTGSGNTYPCGRWCQCTYPILSEEKNWLENTGEFHVVPMGSSTFLWGFHGDSHGASMELHGSPWCFHASVFPLCFHGDLSGTPAVLPWRLSWERAEVEQCLYGDLHWTSIVLPWFRGDFHGASKGLPFDFHARTPWKHSVSTVEFHGLPRDFHGASMVLQWDQGYN